MSRAVAIFVHLFYIFDDLCNLCILVFIRDKEGDMFTIITVSQLPPNDLLLSEPAKSISDNFAVCFAIVIYV